MIDLPGVDIVLSHVGEAVVMNISGELDVTGSAELDDVVRELLDQGAVRLILDLSNVTFIDSTGLGVLVSCRNRCRDRQGDVVLRNPSESTRKVLAITALDQIFTVDSTA